MLQKVKKKLKDTGLWVRFSHSDFYQKLRMPNSYQKQVAELSFYKGILDTINFKRIVIFDVGANIGNKIHIFTKLASKVVAFEPSNSAYNILKKRFTSSNVTIYQCALGSIRSEQVLYKIDNNEAYNSLSSKHIASTVSNRGIATINTVQQSKVKVEVIENFISNSEIPIYIKIDVEGYELEVIKGLKTCVPLISFEANLPEFTNETIEIMNYLSLLSMNGYKYNFSIDNNSLLFEEFIGKKEASHFLTTTQERYIEIYARLTEYGK